MNVTTDLSGVIASGMCIGCGACEMADASVRVSLNPKKLIYEPETAGSQAAADVCPAVAVDYEGLQNHGILDSMAVLTLHRLLITSMDQEPFRIFMEADDSLKQLRQIHFQR